uniref:Uncharacterized protein n=1 Tax=Anguilla anguilla TaxID=7936 RepID=A0A0E9Q478_ANGAN
MKAANHKARQNSPAERFECHIDCAPSFQMSVTD